MYVEALRAINAMGVDYEAQPEECTIVVDLGDGPDGDEDEVEMFEQLEAFGELEY